MNKRPTAPVAVGLDPRIEVRFKGEDQEQKKAQAFLVKAFVLAVFLMAIILVTQFNSFYSAGLILSAPAKPTRLTRRQTVRKTVIGLL